MHVIIMAFALFLNPATGEQIPAQAQVESVQECADVLNANRTPKVVEEGEYAGTWYMVKSVCAAAQEE